jgi:hypothetical protein
LIESKHGLPDVQAPVWSPGGGRIAFLSRGEGGKEVYDIEFTQEGKKFEADIFADGTFDNWEQQISANELPQPVVQTVERHFPKASMKEIMAVTAVTGGSERLEGYEIVVQRAHKRDVEMTIAPDGKVLEGPGKEK